MQKKTIEKKIQKLNQDYSLSQESVENDDNNNSSKNIGNTNSNRKQTERKKNNSTGKEAVVRKQMINQEKNQILLKCTVYGIIVMHL